MPTFMNGFAVLRIFVIWSIVGHCSSFTLTTSGESGEVCGSDGTKCLSGQSTCDRNSGKCVCTRRRHGIGDGRINCYRRSEHYTELLNDPESRSFNDEHVDLSVPCRFMVTHFTSGLENRQQQSIGGCVFKVHGFQQKDKGKMYLAGVDVAFQINYDNGNAYWGSVRMTGKAENGTYTYTVNATEGDFLPDGPFGNDVISYNDRTNNVKVTIMDDDVNNIAMLVIKKCGFRIRLRAYDCTSRRNQTTVPGYSLAVSKAYPPLEFLSDDDVMAMIPLAKSNGFDINNRLVGLLDRRQSMLYRALTSNVQQTQPESNPHCAKASEFLANCSSDQELKEAFDNCHWLLKSPRFIRCFDKTASGKHIMKLFNSCTSVYCGDTRGGTTCQAVRDAITGSGCDEVTGYDKLDYFVAGALCPMDPAAPGIPGLGNARYRGRRRIRF